MFNQLSFSAQQCQFSNIQIYSNIANVTIQGNFMESVSTNKLLIIDSDEELHKKVSKIFRRIYKVELFSNSYELFDHLRNQTYSAIIIKEPLTKLGTGLELAKNINEKALGSEIIVILPEKINHDYFIEPQRHFAIKYIKQPFDDFVFKTNLRAWIEKGEIAKKQIFIQQKRAAASDEMLNITTALKGITSEDDILRQIVTSATKLMNVGRDRGIYYSHLALIDEANQKLFFLKEHHSNDVWERLAKHIDNGVIDLINPKTKNSKPGIVANVYTKKKSQLIGNVKQVKEYICLDKRINSQLAVLLTIDNLPFGIINVEHQAKNAFDELDKQNLQTLANQISIIIENIRKTAVLHKQKRALNILLDYGKWLNRNTFSVEEAIREGTQKARELMNISGREEEYISYFGRYYDASKRANSRIKFLKDDNTPGVFEAIEKNDALTLYPFIKSKHKKENFSSGIIKYSIDRGTYRNNDTKSEEEFVSITDSPGSLLATKVTVDSEIFGILGIESPEKNSFDKSDEENIEALATYISAAIKNSQIQNQLSKEATSFENLIIASAAINESETIELLQEQIVEHAISVLGLSIEEDKCFSHVGLKHANTLKYVKSIGVSPDVEKKIEKDININDNLCGISGHVARTGIEKLNNKLPDYYIKVSEHVTANICVPMKYQGTTIGVITVENSAPFDPHSLETLKLLGIVAAIAYVKTSGYEDFHNALKGHSNSIRNDHEQARWQNKVSFILLTIISTIDAITIFSLIFLATLGNITLNIVELITSLILEGILLFFLNLTKDTKDTLINPFYSDLKKDNDYIEVKKMCNELTDSQMRDECIETILKHRLQHLEKRRDPLTNLNSELKD